jgi:DNA-binding transcriptional regulator YiaG
LSKSPIVSDKPEHRDAFAGSGRRGETKTCFNRIDSMSEENRSQFSRKLESDPELAERSSHVAKRVRDAANEEVQAVERSERLTQADFPVYINARADNSLSEKE